jgi:hypothetical protein
MINKKHLYLLFVILFSLTVMPSSALTTTQTISIPNNGRITYPSEMGDIFWINCQWLLNADGSPNSIAQRIVNAKLNYGNLTILAISNNAPWAERRHGGFLSCATASLITFFHNAGITVFQYVQSGYGWMGENALTVDEVKSQIDQQLAQGGNIDGFFVDEALHFWDNPPSDIWNYYKAISDYIRSKGKLIVFNGGSWQVGAQYLSLCDICCVEHWWRWLQNNPVFAQNQNKFFGISNGRSGVTYPTPNDPPPPVQSWQQAIDETKEAWNLGLKYFMGRVGAIEDPLPPEFEYYLQQIQ